MGGGGRREAGAPRACGGVGASGSGGRSCWVGSPVTWRGGRRAPTTKKKAADEEARAAWKWQPGGGSLGRGDSERAARAGVATGGGAPCGGPRLAAGGGGVSVQAADMSGGGGRFF